MFNISSLSRISTVHKTTLKIFLKNAFVISWLKDVKATAFEKNRQKFQELFNIVLLSKTLF